MLNVQRLGTVTVSPEIVKPIMHYVLLDLEHRNVVTSAPFPQIGLGGLKCALRQASGKRVGIPEQEEMYYNNTETIDSASD
jgi:hypothetical protein